MPAGMQLARDDHQWQHALLAVPAQDQVLAD